MAKQIIYGIFFMILAIIGVSVAGHFYQASKIPPPDPLVMPVENKNTE